MSKKNEIAIAETQFVIPAGDAEEMQAVVAANLGPAAMVDPTLLSRIQIPTGGGQQWEIPTVTDELDHAKEIPCVVVAWSDCRGYWPGDFEFGARPECASTDGLNGSGNPGGVCKACPHSQFLNDERPACTSRRRLFILRAGQVMPDLISLPPTSIKDSTRYLVKLIGVRQPYYGVVTVLGLSKESSGDNIPYSKVTFRCERVLTPDEREQIEAMRAAIQPMLEMSVTRDDADARDTDAGIDL